MGEPAVARRPVSPARRPRSPSGVRGSTPQQRRARSVGQDPARRFDGRSQSGRLAPATGEGVRRSAPSRCGRARPPPAHQRHRKHLRARGSARMARVRHGRLELVADRFRREAVSWRGVVGVWFRSRMRSEENRSRKKLLRAPETPRRPTPPSGASGCRAADGLSTAAGGTGASSGCPCQRCTARRAPGGSRAWSRRPTTTARCDRREAVPRPQL